MTVAVTTPYTALTDVVVEAAVTSLLLALAVQAHKRFGTLDPQELASLKG